MNIKRMEENMKEKISKCIDTLLRQSNLCGCFEKSPTNLLYEGNIIIVCCFYRERIHVFDVYIPCYQIHKNSIYRKSI